MPHVRNTQVTSQQSELERGAAYYAGLVTTDVQETNQATGADMLKRNLQLAGAPKAAAAAEAGCSIVTCMHRSWN